MTYDEFITNVNVLGLSILVIRDNLWGIGYSGIANQMVYFNPTVNEEDYTGTVDIKSYNIKLFTAKEIKSSLILINELLLTKVSDRGDLKLKSVN